MCTENFESLKFFAIDELQLEKKIVLKNCKEEIESTTNITEIENIASLAIANYTNIMRVFYEKIDKQLDIAKFTYNKDIFGEKNLYILNIIKYLEDIKEKETKKYIKAEKIIAQLVLKKTYEDKMLCSEKFEMLFK